MNHYSIIFILILIIISVVDSRCPNSCTGHGYCQTDGTCECYTGWTIAPDCSLRNCPNGTSFTGRPYGSDFAHPVYECSLAGSCDYQTGTCKCLPGYTGIACQRKSCPNSCSGHGTCSTIEDLSLNYGPFVNYTAGPDYSNWDNSSIQVCNCDDGYFGADCSLVYCPKGDDPLTTGQTFRKINWELTGSGTGKIGIQFQGRSAYLDLNDIKHCSHQLSYHGKFGLVGCNYQIHNNNNSKTFTLTFYNWPVSPRDNNLFINDGNPSINEFYCDQSRLLVPSYYCTFTDLVNTNVIEYTTCSNRGTCNYRTGRCKCKDGFSGPACSNRTEIFTSTAFQPGFPVKVTYKNLTNTVSQYRSSLNASTAFYLIQSIANDEMVFSVRGDGLVTSKKVLTLDSGVTIINGGLNLDGGATIESYGLSISSSSSNSKTAIFSSSDASVLGSTYTAADIETLGTDTVHSLLMIKNKDGQSRTNIRADGRVIIRAGGLRVTGGTTIYSTGLTLTGGVSVHNGLRVTSGGLTTVAGGMTIQSGGAVVFPGGILVSGSSTIRDGVIINTGGLSVNSGGLSSTGGATIFGGLQATGGFSVYSSGLYVKKRGMTLNSGGLNVNGSLVLPLGIYGLTVNDGGISAANITVHGGFAVNGLLYIKKALLITGGLSVFGSGIYVTKGLTISTRGLAVSAGISISGGLVVSNDLSIHTGKVTATSLGTSDLSVVSGNFIANAGAVLIATTINGDFYVSGTTTVPYVASNPILYFDGGASIKGTMSSYSPNYATSDIRLKTNISPINNALNKVQALRGVYYDWVEGYNSNDKSRKVGFIAQNVIEVLPEVIKKPTTGSDHLKIDYSAMVPLVVEAINDLNKVIENKYRAPNNSNAQFPSCNCTELKISKLKELSSLQKEYNSLLKDIVSFQNDLRKFKQSTI